MVLNKKSEIGGRKVIFYIAAAIATSITFLIIAFIIPSSESEIAIIPQNLENYLLVQRFFNSPLCFAFQYEDDKSGRVYPWTLDLEKFKQENIDSCYGAVNTGVKAYRLTLNYKKMPTPPATASTDEKITISTKNWEGFPEMGQKSQVFVYDSESKTIQKADLIIEVQSGK